MSSTIPVDRRVVTESMPTFVPRPDRSGSGGQGLLRAASCERTATTGIASAYGRHATTCEDGALSEVAHSAHAALSKGAKACKLRE